ncbi:MAG: hypothetical protein E7378_02990 [Clostridiales bacterium]|nr:hypothetical protein [Clostridiales bacterium]
MNFGNLFGRRGGGCDHGENDCLCDIIWIILLLSICGNGFNICDCLGGDWLGIIVLLLILCNCNGSKDMGGCRG